MSRKRLGQISLADRKAEYEIVLWESRNKSAAFLQKVVRKWLAKARVLEKQRAIHRWNRYRIASE